MRGSVLELELGLELTAILWESEILTWLDYFSDCQGGM